MGITVNTNMAAIDAINNLNKTGRSLSRSFERISSGLRIARAADDAAGLGVAENLKVAAASAQVAARNINDGVSMIAVAEGATAEVGNILSRMRELAVQSASETLDDDERAYIQTEFAALQSEIDRIANTTEFNGNTLTSGTVTSIAVQVGINNTSNDQITITMGDLRATTLGVDTTSMDVSTASAASTALTAIDAAITDVAEYRSSYGAGENRLDSALSNIESFAENTLAAESRIRDADFAYETAELTRNQILQQAGVSVLAQAKGINNAALTLLE